MSEQNPSEHDHFSDDPWGGQFDNIMKTLIKRGRKELEEHLSHIVMIDVANKVPQKAEFELPDFEHSTISRQPSGELLSVASSGGMYSLNLESLEKKDLDHMEFAGPDQVEHLALGKYGSFAAKPVGSDELIWGKRKSRQQATRLALGEPSSFGFLSSGVLVHLDDKSLVNVDCKVAGVNRMEKRWLRRDVAIPVGKLVVQDQLVLIEEIELDKDHEREMRQPVTWIGGVPPDYYTHWYFMSHRVVSFADESPKDIFHAYKNYTERELTDKFLYQGLRTQLHLGNFVTNVEVHPFDMADAFCSTPLYNKVHFYQQDSRELGNVRIASGQLTHTAHAVDAKGDRGFVGKYDGSIELVDLSGAPDAGPLRRGYSTNAWTSENGRSAHLSVQWEGDHYHHRKAPASITFWQAHNTPIKHLYAQGDTLNSIDQAGTLRQWDLQNLI